MVASGWQHQDGSIGMVASGWQCQDCSIMTVASGHLDEEKFNKFNLIYNSLINGKLVNREAVDLVYRIN